MDSIIAKAKKCMGDSKHQKDVSIYLDDILAKGVTPKGEHSNIHTVEEAGEKFAETLIGAIEMQDMSDKLQAALIGFDIGQPFSAGNDYKITVSYSNDMHRESLYPEGYPGGLYSLASLYNVGASLHKPVYRINEDGTITYSPCYTTAYHFEDFAIDTFMNSFAKEYNVVKIDTSESLISGGLYQYT